MLKREERIEAVQALMITGEHQIPKITRMLNTTHKSRFKQRTIEADMKEIHRRNESWYERVADSEASLRAAYFHKILTKNVTLLEAAIEKALKDTDNRGVYRAAQVYPQLLATIREVFTIEDKFPLYQANIKLRTRLKAREAELEAKLNETGTVKAESHS